MNVLEKFKKNRDFTVIEGEIGPEAVEFLQGLVKQYNVQKGLEIGFNAGMSSSVFLDVGLHTLTSVDIGWWDYVLKAKRLIDGIYPGKHTLIIGDSRVELPKLKGSKFDMVFVDGGHDHPIPYEDIKNSLKLLDKGGLIIVDDYCKTYGSTGVIQDWDKVVSEGLIEQKGVFEYGPLGMVYGIKN